ELLTLDANILVYSQDQREPRKHAVAMDLLAQLRTSNAILTTITLGEFFNVMVRKFVTAAEARLRLEDFITLVPVISYETRHIVRAAREVESRRFAVWDAVMLASADEAGCTICLSEDMADGARLGNIVVKHPFSVRGLTEAVRAFLHQN